MKGTAEIAAVIKPKSRMRLAHKGLTDWRHLKACSKIT